MSEFLTIWNLAWGALAVAGVAFTIGLRIGGKYGEARGHARGYSDGYNDALIHVAITRRTWRDRPK